MENKLITLLKLRLLLLISVLLILFLSTKTYCQENKLAQIIKINKPLVEDTISINIAKIVNKYSSIYKIDSKIVLAILMQESSYNIEARNCKRGVANLIDIEEYKNLNYVRHSNSVCTDFGIGQIHYNTILAYKFNIYKLLTDLDYSIKATFVVLKDIKKSYGSKEKDYWTRYNSSNKDKREVYKKLVNRWVK